MKLGKGSTDFFTVTLLLFEDVSAAAAAEARIADLRAELRFRPDFEFHFNKLRPEFRLAFLRAIAPVPFAYFAATIDKRKLPPDSFSGPETFYRHACGLAFQSARSRLRNATVIIDGSGDRAFRLELSTYLRKSINGPDEGKRIGKIKIQGSDRNDLLQMVDVICGAVARCHSGKPDAEEYRDLVAHREKARIVWPE